MTWHANSIDLYPNPLQWKLNTKSITWTWPNFDYIPSYIYYSFVFTRKFAMEIEHKIHYMDLTKLWLYSVSYRTLIRFHEKICNENWTRNPLHIRDQRLTNLPMVCITAMKIEHKIHYMDMYQNWPIWGLLTKKKFKFDSARNQGRKWSIFL